MSSPRSDKMTSPEAKKIFRNASAPARQPIGEMSLQMGLTLRAAQCYPQQLVRLVGHRRDAASTETADLV
jgi:hypothetical protein